MPLTKLRALEQLAHAPAHSSLISCCVCPAAGQLQPAVLPSQRGPGPPLAAKCPAHSRLHKATQLPWSAVAAPGVPGTARPGCGRGCECEGRNVTPCKAPRARSCTGAGTHRAGRSSLSLSTPKQSSSDLSMTVQQARELPSRCGLDLLPRAARRPVCRPVCCAATKGGSSSSSPELAEKRGSITGKRNTAFASSAPPPAHEPA